MRLWTDWWIAVGASGPLPWVMHAAAAPRRRSSGLARREFLKRAGAAGAGLAFGARAAAAAEGARPPELAFVRSTEALQLNLGTRMVLRYQLTRPGLGGASTESGCYLHPLCTPSGLELTEVGPDDHRHHRGVFCGWVEMHGPADADFWGWGEPAPVKNRRIVNRSLDAPPPALGYARFRAVNQWLADDKVMVSEDIRIGTAQRDGGTVLDIAAQYSVTAEVTLARWAFGGFAVRGRKDGQAVAVGAEGEVKLPPPKHTEPDSNWPAAQWYGLQFRFGDGRSGMLAVAGRGTNPPTTWHVVPGIGLINPSITAPGPVRLAPDKPLALRYRVMAFDGTPKLELVNQLADTWFRGVTT